MSDGKTGLQLRSLIKKSAELEISLVNVPIPEPKEDEIVVRVECPFQQFPRHVLRNVAALSRLANRARLKRSPLHWS